MAVDYDVLIVGAGPGGLTAGIYAARYGLKTAIIDKGMPGGALLELDEIENYPGFETIKGPELAERMKAHAEKAGVEILWDEVSAVVPHTDEGYVEVQAGYSYTAHVLIWATGAEHRKLGVPGETEFTGRGVSYCATCDGPFFRGKTIAVVGGGNSAFAEALVLANLADKLYLIHRRQGFRAEKALVDKLKAHDNVEFILDTVVEEIKGDMKVNALKIKNVVDGKEEDLPVDAVFIAIGLVPRSEILKGIVDIDHSGAIITDERMRTSHPLILAVGDVRNTPLRQIITAAADGAVAAETAHTIVENLHSSAK